MRLLSLAPPFRGSLHAGGGRAGGREAGKKGGGCWRCWRGGTYLPPGRERGDAARGLLPVAPSDSCRTDAATAGGDTPHPIPSRTARALGNAGPDGADVSAAGSPPLCLQLETAPPPGRCGAGGGSSPTAPGAGGGRGLPQAQGSNHRSRAGWQAVTQGDGQDTQGHLPGSPQQQRHAWWQWG